MGIRKQGERVKGTTRVSFGDRKLMTRLWIADKTSRYEKRRTTRQLNKKEKESLEQSPMHRALKGFQSFLKDARAPAKEFDVPEDEEDIVALETMSHMVWYELTHRYAALQDDAHILDLFLRDVVVRGSKKGDAGKKDGEHSRSREFAAALFSEMGDETDNSDFQNQVPSSAKEVERIVRAVQQLGSHDQQSMPLLVGRRNMRLMHQYRRLKRRVEHFADTLTASSAQVLVGHLYHSSATASDTQDSQKFAFATPAAPLSQNNRHVESGVSNELNDIEIIDDNKIDSVENNRVSAPIRSAHKKRKRVDENEHKEQRHQQRECFDYDNFKYDFDAGGLQSTDALWPLMDGSASSSRLTFQPKQWMAIGDSVIDEIAQMRSGEGRGTHGASSSVGQYSLQSNRDAKRRRTSDFSGSATMDIAGRANSSSESASTVLGFGFADEERYRRHLRSEQRRNNVSFSHSYELERQQSAWTICQRCREPVHTCDMVMRESIGIENVACFHPACLTAVTEARLSRKRQETLDDRDNNAEVRSLTAIHAPEEQKQRIRSEVCEAGSETIRRCQRERQQFLATRKTSSNAAAIQSATSPQTDKGNTFDDLLKSILGTENNQ